MPLARPASLLCLLAVASTPLRAQSSPYLPLDDPRLPLFEHLVARGTVRDPSPMVRPFRRADGLAALLAADTIGAPDRRIIQELRGAWVQDTALAAWGIGGRAGFDAYESGARDLLHPGGDGGLRPYGELLAAARFGPLVAVSRPAVEPRLDDDPAWPGRRDLVIVGRMAEAYLSGQWRFGTLFLGTMDRHWGPAGVAGIPLSAEGYPRTETAFEIGGGRVRLSAHLVQLTDDRDSLGGRIPRYWFAHRLSLRPSDRLAIAFWETVVVGGADRSFDARWRNPASFLLLANQYGLGSDANIMVGTDLTWWATPALRLEGQFALDDLNYPDPEGDEDTPSRYAVTLAASGPMRGAMSWKLLYTQATSLAFRTRNPAETYADAGVGIGRGYPDHDQASLFVTIPVGVTTLLTPELTVLRQGEGRLTDPYPLAEIQAGGFPRLFLGTVERTTRAALGVNTGRGALQATGSLGLHYVADADHVEGRHRTALVGRLRVTIGIATGGRLQ